MDPLVAQINNIISSEPDEIYYSKDLLKDLISLIHADPQYQCFFNHCHQLAPSAGRCFNQELQFPNALIQRSKEVGAKQAISELRDYLKSSENNIGCGLLLYGIHIDSEFEFSNGVKIIKSSNLEDSNLRRFLQKENISTGGIDTSILIFDYKTKKEYYSSLNTQNKKPDFTDLEQKTKIIKILNDTRMLLSLARNHKYGIPVVGSFEIIPDKLSVLNNGIGYGNYPEPRTSIGPSIIGLEYNKADELIQKFTNLSNVNKDKIRIALKRINDAKIDPDWANKNINLRICLENLFYTGNEPIAKTISERAPSYTNFTKRRCRNIYKFLSSAVHTGRAPQHANITEQEITKELHNTILKYLDEGKYPTWTTRSKKTKIINLLKSVLKKMR